MNRFWAEMPKKAAKAGPRKTAWTWNFRPGLPLSSAFVEQIREATAMSLGTIILIILVIALLGGFSGIGGGPFYGTGYYGGGGLGLVVVVLLILILLGKI
jgi:hypothetical protein